MNYATFWQRFSAGWIDFFVFLPIIFLQVWLESLSKNLALALVIPMSAAYCAYTIYLHGKFGQTIGKRAMGIRVLKITGEQIGWRTAWLRSSLDVVFAILTALSSITALLLITDPEYYGVDWIQRANNLQAHEPKWLSWSELASDIWIWSELVIMFSNKRRRALHDFIAGTVVVADTKAH